MVRWGKEVFEVSFLNVFILLIGIDFKYLMDRVFCWNFISLDFRYILILV